MDLVLDIGNYRIKGAFFDGNKLESPFVIAPCIDELKRILEKNKIDFILISSTHPSNESEVEKLLALLHISYQILNFSEINVTLDVEEKEALGQDRIANVYGALFHFPQNDCVVVDMGSAVTFDYVSCSGSYKGGAIYPGVDIGAQALHRYTELLPRVNIERPEHPVAKTTKTHIQSGLYWGLLGAIERITFEMRQTSPTPSDVKIIATGGHLRQLKEPFVQDLGDLTDLIDPLLTLTGLHEIMKERK